MLTTKLLHVLFGVRWWSCSFVGTALAIAGNLKKADAQAEADMFNAQRAGEEAIQNTEQTNRAVTGAVENETAQLGSVRAAYGASGVTMQGTAQDVIASQAGMLNEKVQGILSAGTFKTGQLNQEANQYAEAAKQAKQAGIFGAVGAGVNTAESVGAAVYKG